jgi:hypothetical protein
MLDFFIKGLKISMTRTIFKPIGSRTKNYLATTIESFTREDAIKCLKEKKSIDEVLWPSKEKPGYNSLLRSEIGE